MAEKKAKIQKPIKELQQLRRLSYNPAAASQGPVSAAQAAAGAAGGSPQQKGTQVEMELEKVIGTSSKGANSLQVNPANGDICYLAGSRLVIYSPRDAKQVKFLASRTSRPFQCARFSSDGKFLAAGESAFRLPQITIWEIEYEEVEQVKQSNPSTPKGSAAALEGGITSTSSIISNDQTTSNEVVRVKKAISYTEIKHLQGHKYGIEAVLFSPRNDFLISLGDPNDRGLFVWDWRNETKISQNKLSKPAMHVEISPDQDYFITAGYAHLKYWYLNEETGLPDARRPNDKSPPIIQAESADLSKVKVQIFVGIAIQGVKVFVLASDGHIYVFDKSRKLLKWMNIKVPRAFSCSAQEGRLYCSCSDGIIRIFATETLQHLLSLSKPPPLGSTNLLAGNGRIKIQQNKATKFADVIACAIDHLNNRAVALYSDRMMFVWDVAELKSVTVLRSMYSHSGPIHDIQAVSNQHQIGLSPKAMSLPRCENEDNLTKFVTCSSDRTIRFWNFIDPSVPSQKHQEIYQCLAKNAYCKDMSQMIFITSSLRESRESQTEESQVEVTPYDHFKAGPLDRGEDGQPISQEQNALNLMDMVDSIRCIRVSPDGNHLASGDEVGNIRIHQLDDPVLPQKLFMESHDNEVISLAYSQQVPSNKRQIADSPQAAAAKSKQRYLLASGGRDKNVLLYDSENDYEAFMTLDHHTSTITSMQFNEYSTVEENRPSANQSYQRHIDLISSSADKNLISKQLDFDRFQIHSNDLATAGDNFDNPLFKLKKSQICKDKILSLDVARQAQYMITGHDKSLSLWKLPMFEKVWEKRVATMEKEQAKSGKGQQPSGTNQVQLRVLIDDYASVVVSSSTSKRVTIYEAATGQPLCRAQPGQITTAMCFSNNMKHLITTSDNGLIFVWRVPDKIAQCLQKIKNEGQRIVEINYRVPSIIEEVEEKDELGESTGPKPVNAASKPQLQITADTPVAEVAPDKVAKGLNEGDEDDEDFDFKVPDKLKIKDRDPTEVKKRKNEVVDVLGEIKKATNFIDKIAASETPNTKTGAQKIKEIDGADQEVDECEDEDDEAQEFFSKKRAAAYPFKSKAKQPEGNNTATEDQTTAPATAGTSSAAVEESKAPATLMGKQASAECIGDLSEGDSDTQEVATGEQEGADEKNDATERQIWRNLEKNKYQARYTNYNEEENESRMDMLRRSSDMIGRRSITSKLLMRRSTTYVPGLNGVNDSILAMQAANHPTSDMQSDKRTVSEFDSRPLMFNKVVPPLQHKVDNQSKDGDQVTDILDDKEILAPLKPIPEQAAAIKNDSGNGSKTAGGGVVDLLGNNKGPALKISDFEASLTKQNSAAAQKAMPSDRSSPSKRIVSPRKAGNNEMPMKKERSGWGASASSGNAVTRPNQMRSGGVLQTEVAGADAYKGFTGMPGKPIDTRPTMIFNNNDGQPNERKRSPIKRMVDKMFGRSPNKKRVGMSAVEMVDPVKPLQAPPQMNLGNFKIQNDYVKDEAKRQSPTARSQPVLMKALTAEVAQTQREQASPTIPIPKGAKVQSQMVQQPGPPQANQNELEAEEQKFNQQLKNEIDSINASLRRVQGIVSQQKAQHMKTQQSFLESQSAADISMELKGPPPQTRVHQTVSKQLFQTMTKWNSMVQDLQQTTDFDIEKVSMTYRSESDQSHQTLLLNFDQSRASQAQSQMSRETIKEDTRDLLDKYSQLLLESLQSKLSAAQPLPQSNEPQPKK